MEGWTSTFGYRYLLESFVFDDASIEIAESYYEHLLVVNAFVV